jgi:glycosyltransferase involved in cell wall biosynthesis
LAIAGAGVKALAEQAARLGVADYVILVDHWSTASGAALELPHPGLVDLYRSADVFVMPSLVETFGVVLIEAMAAGLPVITSDSPGCRDVVRHNLDGVVVPPGDASAFAAAMRMLATAPDRRRHLSECSLARAAEFDWGSVVDRYVALYRQVLVRPRASPR